MKKVICLVFVVYVALFFTGCAGFMDKLIVCEDDTCKADTDADGVPDCRDACPDTPKGVPVCTKGCPKDTDGDGVLDYLDKCPGTPKGAKVNSDGCWILEGVNFDTDKSDIKIVYSAKLDEVATVLNNNPDVKIEIQGHTDSDASDAYNQKLSEQRAAAVKAYLVEKGIAADRMTEKGFGETIPVEPNDTEEGKAKNRRVELKPIK